MSLNRKCPECEKELAYGSKVRFKEAVENNKSCLKCTLVKRNKTREYTKKDKNPQWKGYNEIPFSWFSKYFLRKSKSKRTGTITIEDVYNLWIKQDKKCCLSGVIIGFNDDGKGHTCSIDRIDSKKEYTLDNIQLVHKDINYMKNRFSQEYFIKMCKLVTNNRWNLKNIKEKQ